MRNLLALLDDPGATFTPGLLPYLIDGAPADLRQLLLQKRDGRFFLVLWRNLSLYDRDTRIDYTDAQIGVVSMTLQLQILQKITTWSPTAGVVLDPANPTATAGGALSITTGLSSAFTMAGGIRVIEIGAP